MNLRVVSADRNEKLSFVDVLYLRRHANILHMFFLKRLNIESTPLKNRNSRTLLKMLPMLLHSQSTIRHQDFTHIYHQKADKKGISKTIRPFYYSSSLVVSSDALLSESSCFVIFFHISLSGSPLTVDE